jgi:uncharacterized RDD family membrane protein YckC
MTTESSTPAAQPAVEDVTGIRIVAGIIDLVLMIVLFLVMAALFGDFGSGDDGEGFEVNLSGAPFLLYLLLNFGYYFVLEGSSGQTFGKKVMGIQVVSLEGPLTWGKVAIRTILRIVDGLPVLYLVAVICAFATKKHQRIGDMAAGTVVVRATAPSPGSMG